MIVLQPSSFTNSIMRHIRDIRFIGRDNKTLRHILGDIYDLRFFLARVKIIRRSSAHRTLFNIEDPDNILRPHRDLPAQKQVHIILSV